MNTSTHPQPTLTHKDDTWACRLIGPNGTIFFMMNITLIYRPITIEKINANTMIA